jgi:hypothetical protein
VGKGNVFLKYPHAVIKSRSFSIKVLLGAFRKEGAQAIEAAREKKREKEELEKRRQEVLRKKKEEEEEALKKSASITELTDAEKLQKEIDGKNK